MGRIRCARSSVNGSLPSRPPMSSGTPPSLASSASPSFRVLPPRFASAETGARVSHVFVDPIAATTCSVSRAAAGRRPARAPSPARASSPRAGNCTASVLHAPRSVPSSSGNTSARTSFCACPTVNSSGRYRRSYGYSCVTTGSSSPTSADCCSTSSAATSAKPPEGPSAAPWSAATRHRRPTTPGLNSSLEPQPGHRVHRHRPWRRRTLHRLEPAFSRLLRGIPRRRPAHRRRPVDPRRQRPSRPPPPRGPHEPGSRGVPWSQVTKTPPGHHRFPVAGPRAQAGNNQRGNPLCLGCRDRAQRAPRPCRGGAGSLHAGGKRPAGLRRGPGSYALQVPGVPRARRSLDPALTLAEGVGRIPPGKKPQ